MDKLKKITFMIICSAFITFSFFIETYSCEDIDNGDNGLNKTLSEVDLIIGSIELENCYETNDSCDLQEQYVNNIQNKLLSYEHGNKPYFINRKYGKRIYRQILEDKTLIEISFDEFITAELIKFNGGEMLSEENGYTDDEIRLIYTAYVETQGFDSINDKITAVEDDEARAIYEYEMFLLLTDNRFAIN